MKKSVFSFLAVLTFVTAIFSGCKNPINNTVTNSTVPENFEEDNIKTYSIKYENLLGADNSQNPKKYKAGTVIELKNPIISGRSEALFKGWYLESDFSGTVINKLDNDFVRKVQSLGGTNNGETNNVKLYGRWIGHDKQTVNFGNINYSGYNYKITDEELGLLLIDEFLNIKNTGLQNIIDQEKQQPFIELMSTGKYAEYFFTNDWEKDLTIKTKMKNSNLTILYTTVFDYSYLIIHRYLPLTESGEDELITCCFYLKTPNGSTEIIPKDINEYEPIMEKIIKN